MTPAQDVICAAGLAKYYTREVRSTALMGDLLRGRSQALGFEALAPLDFTVRRGECFGVIGRNGSGKSTLLKLLCGILQPSRGSVVLAGRALGLIELGAGFHPDFTGRENARINALLQGLDADGIALRMPLIEAFADIGAYFDRPVRTYSSGMYARLGFAVMVHVDADILVVDEILSVGDAAFQRKCARQIRRFRDEGGTVVLVSHNVDDVSRLCDRTLWLDQGKMRATGPAAEVAAAYQRHMLGRYYMPGTEIEPPAARSTVRPAVPSRPQAQDWQGRMIMRQGPFNLRATGHGHGGAVLTDAGFYTACGARAEVLAGGASVVLRIRCRAERALHAPILGFMFRDENGRNLFGDNTYLTTANAPRQVPAGQVIEAQFHFDLPFLPVGKYTLAPSVIEGTQEDHIHLHWVENAVALHVVESPVEIGLVGVPMKEIG